MAILTLVCIYRYSFYTENRIKDAYNQRRNASSIILAIIVFLFIGFRPLSGAFVDMMNYATYYSARQQYIKGGFEFDPNSTNFIFDNLFNYLSLNYYEIIIFFVIIALIYVFCIFFALKKIYPNDLFYALVVYLGAFSTFSYGTNGIKAGAAASIFLLVFAYYKKPIIAALFLFLSLGFHHSMILPIVAFLLAYFVRNPKFYFYGWIFCLVMAIFHVTAFQELFGNLTDEGSEYLLADEDAWGGRKGFRWDFVLYVLPALYIGWWTIYKHKVSDCLFQLLLCTFLTVNGAWMLCMYMPYNNRLAYLSWFILPVIYIYPFMKFKLQENQYKLLNYIAGMYISFSIFSIFFF